MKAPLKAHNSRVCRMKATAARVPSQPRLKQAPSRVPSQAKLMHNAKRRSALLRIALVVAQTRRCVVFFNKLIIDKKAERSEHRMSEGVEEKKRGRGRAKE